MTSITIPIQQSGTKPQLVLSEQTIDILSHIMIDRLIQLGILEERKIEEYLIGTSELGKDLRELNEEKVKASRLLSHEEVFGESL